MTPSVPPVLIESASSLLSPLHIGHDPLSAQWGSFFLHYGSHPRLFSRLLDSFRQLNVLFLSVSMPKRMTTTLAVTCDSGYYAPAHSCSLFSARLWKGGGAAGGQKDTVSPREQHCPSYHFSKDAANWPHVHCSHMYTNRHMHERTLALSTALIPNLCVECLSHAKYKRHTKNYLTLPVIT